MEQIDFKECTICHQSKPLSEFHKSAQCYGGVRPECKCCRKETERNRLTEKQADKKPSRYKSCTSCYRTYGIFHSNSPIYKDLCRFCGSSAVEPV